MRPLAESERIGELIALMDDIEKNDDELWDRIEIVKVETGWKQGYGGGKLFDRSREVIWTIDTVIDAKLIRAGLERLLKGEGE